MHKKSKLIAEGCGCEAERCMCPFDGCWSEFSEKFVCLYNCESRFIRRATSGGTPPRVQKFAIDGQASF